MLSLKKDPEYIQKRKQKSALKLEKKDIVADHVNNKLNQHQLILSSQSVVDEINSTGRAINLKAHQVNYILKYDLGLKYKALKFGEVQANT